MRHPSSSAHAAVPWRVAARCARTVTPLTSCLPRHASIYLHSHAVQPSHAGRLHLQLPPCANGSEPFINTYNACKRTRPRWCDLPPALHAQVSEQVYDGIRVHIREGMLGDGLGAKVWLVAHILCRELTGHPAIVAGKRVLEVGMQTMRSAMQAHGWYRPVVETALVAQGWNRTSPTVQV